MQGLQADIRSLRTARTQNSLPVPAECFPLTNGLCCSNSRVEEILSFYLAFLCVFFFFHSSSYLEFAKQVCMKRSNKRKQSQKTRTPSPSLSCLRHQCWCYSEIKCLPYMHFLIQRCHMELPGSRGHVLPLYSWEQNLQHRHIFTEGPGTSLKPSQQG